MELAIASYQVKLEIRFQFQVHPRKEYQDGIKTVDEVFSKTYDLSERLQWGRIIQFINVLF